MQLFFDDGDQYVGGHGAPDLRLDRILAVAQEFLDPQVLFDPLEEQLNLPAAFVQRSNGQGGQRRVVGQKNQCLARFRVFEADAPQMLGILPCRGIAIEHDPLIANDARIALAGRRIHAQGIHRRLGAGDKKGTGYSRVKST